MSSKSEIKSEIKFLLKLLVFFAVCWAIGIYTDIEKVKTLGWLMTPVTGVWLLNLYVHLLIAKRQDGEKPNDTSIN